MIAKFPSVHQEYQVSRSLSDEDENPPADKVVIDGYEVVFDKKVLLTPVDVVAMDLPAIISNQ